MPCPRSSGSTMGPQVRPGGVRGRRPAHGAGAEQPAVLAAVQDERGRGHAGRAQQRANERRR